MPHWYVRDMYGRVKTVWINALSGLGEKQLQWVGESNDENDTEE